MRDSLLKTESGIDTSHTGRTVQERVPPPVYSLLQSTKNYVVRTESVTNGAGIQWYMVTPNNSFISGTVWLIICWEPDNAFIFVCIMYIYIVLKSYTSLTFLYFS